MTYLCSSALGDPHQVFKIRIIVLIKLMFEYICLLHCKMVLYYDGRSAVKCYNYRILIGAIIV